MPEEELREKFEKMMNEFVKRVEEKKARPVWNCHFKTGTHEVGCPHRTWKQEDIQEAFEHYRATNSVNGEIRFELEKSLHQCREAVEEAEKFLKHRNRWRNK